MNRKQQSANFSNEEKNALLNIIVKYQSVIENKKTDNTTIQEKNRAWVKVEAEFNAISPDGCYRNCATLKKFYENKKKEARKAAAEEKFEIRCTGGGPPQRVKKDPAHELILSLMNRKTVQGFSNRFDSDSNKKILTQNKAETNLHEKGVEFELNTDAVVIEIENATGVGDYGLTDEENEYNKSGDTQDFFDMLPEPDLEDINLATPMASKDLTADDDLLFMQPQNKKYTINKSEANTWKKYNPSNLQNTPSKELRNPQSTPKSKEMATQNKRKRPATVVRALTQSNIAAKYGMLVEKRLEIANMTIVEFHQKTDEHLKKMELLDLEIAIKKRQLNR